MLKQRLLINGLKEEDLVAEADLKARDAFNDVGNYPMSLSHASAAEEHNRIGHGKPK
jgi:hypothetical protein